MTSYIFYASCMLINQNFMKGRLWTTKKLKWSDVYEPKHTGHKLFFFQNAFLLVRRSDERLSKHQTSAMYERELSNENNCLL